MKNNKVMNLIPWIRYRLSYQPSYDIVWIAIDVYESQTQQLGCPPHEADDNEQLISLNAMADAGVKAKADTMNWFRRLWWMAWESEKFRNMLIDVITILLEQATWDREKTDSDAETAAEGPDAN